MDSNEIFEKFEFYLPKIKKICYYLYRIHPITIEEILHEYRIKWMSCADKYKNDEEYFVYMITVMKNRMKDLRKEKFKESKDTVSAEILQNKDDYESSHNNSAEVFEDYRETPIHEKLIIQEYVSSIKEKLTEEQYNIFRMLTEGYPIADIEAETGFNKNKIILMKKNKIWPVVKEVMNIDDEKYYVLTSSGRICLG